MSRRDELDPHAIDDCLVIAETSKAILVRYGDAGKPEQAWIPKSQLHDDTEVWEKDDEGTCVVSGWFAQQKGWA